MPDALSLEDQIIAALRRISRAIDLRSRLLLKRHGLTVPQLAALKAIQRAGSTTIGSLAREIHLGHATVTGILGRLEKNGLVKRTRGSQDRRSVLVELTEAGSRLVDEAPSLLQDRFREELTCLQEWEQTMILATLQRIATMMDAEAIEASPVLGSGSAAANEDDLSQYLEKAVTPTSEEPPAKEPPATRQD